MVHLIEPKKKEVQEFVTRLEVDAALIQLASKIEEGTRRYKSLFDQTNAFIEKYNQSMRDLNGIHEEFATTILSIRNEVEQLKTRGGDDGK